MTTPDAAFFTEAQGTAGTSYFRYCRIWQSLP